MAREQFEPKQATMHKRRYLAETNKSPTRGQRMCRTSDTAAVVIDAVKRATMRPEHEPLDELLKLNAPAAWSFGHQNQNRSASRPKFAPRRGAVCGCGVI